MAAAGTDILARLQVLLDADTAEFDRNIEGAADKADTNFGKMQKSFDMVKAGFGAVSAGITAALGVMDTAVFATAVAIGQNVIEMDNMAKVAGITTQELIGLKMAGASMGLELDRVGDVATDFNEKIFEAVNGNKEAAAAFDALQVKITDSNGEMRQAMDVMSDVADSFAKMEDGATKSTLATLLGGDAFREFIPILNGGAEALEDAQFKAEKLGFSLSNEQIAIISEFESEWGNAKTSMEGFATQVVVGLSPALKDVSYLIRETTSNADTLRGTVDFLDTSIRTASAGWVLFKGAIGDTSKYMSENATLIDGLKARVLAFADASIRAKILIGGLPKDEPVNKIELPATPNLDGLLASAQAAADAAKKEYSKEVAARFAAAQNAEAAAKSQAEAAKKAKAESDAAAKAAQNAQDQIQKAYESQESGLKRQIALFDITTTAAQMKYDLENTEMAKFAPQQKAYLQGLAQELDLKKATKLYEDSKKSLNDEANSLAIKYNLSRQIYDLQIAAQEKYKELSEDRRNELIDLEIKNKVTADYQSLVSSLADSEESRYSSVAEQINSLNFALNIGITDATAYADQLQRIFDKSSILPDFSTGNLDKAGIESAQLELENKYMLEQELQANFLNNKAINEEAYNERILNLELDYNLRSNALKDQADAELAARKKAEQDKTVAFFNKGLEVMANSSEKYAKAARAAQKLQALYKIGVETKTAAISAYQWAVGFGGPVAGALAAAAAVAFGMAQAKAVISDSGSSTATAVTPSTPATTVTPVAEQPVAESSQKQNLTIAIPADTLFTGRAVVDLVNDALADGKKLNIGSLSFIGT